MGRQNRIWINGFWDRLDDELKKQKRSKSDLARKCGFSRKNLIQNEYHDNLSLPYFVRICAELNVSADYLLFGKKEK